MRGREGDPRFEWIDPATGDPVPPRSDLGFFLYLMHFLWPIPGGGYVAGAAAVLLLFILISGVIIHLNKLWQELALFRPSLRLRLVWSDAHKVLGVIGLPFQIVIAWTGALLCLQSTVGPVFVQTTLGGDRGALDHALSLGASVRPAGEPGVAPDVRLILARAREALPQARHTQMIFRNLGDRDAFVDVRGEQEDGLLRQTSVRISARDGAVLFARGPGGASRYSRVTEAFYALHLASYGGAGVRVAYALLALLGALGIVTGVLVWLERRRRRGLGAGDVLLARLTAGGCAGACLAVAALFMANQLLPDDLPGRPGWEHRAFYAAWGAAVVFCLARRSAAASARDLLLVAGGLLAIVPMLDGLRNHRVPFDPRAPAHVLGPDVGLLCGAALLVVAGLLIRRIAARADAEERAGQRQAASSLETSPAGLAALEATMENGR
jgi:uncharacterized iron-regulated membrane protein